MWLGIWVSSILQFIKLLTDCGAKDQLGGRREAQLGIYDACIQVAIVKYSGSNNAQKSALNRVYTWREIEG